MKSCVIVSGAPSTDVEYIRRSIPENTFIIAADSGYRVLEKIGVKPDVIIADFDSSEQPLEKEGVITFPIEKEATDTFNCVRYAVGNGFGSIVILNALGGRMDHTYANILCLDYCRKHGVKACIADRHNRISLIDRDTVIKKEYQWFSLFAFLEPCTGVSLRGAHYTQAFYNLDAMDIMPGDQFAQSNYIENDECEIRLKSGTLLLIEANDL